VAFFTKIYQTIQSFQGKTLKKSLLIIFLQIYVLKFLFSQVLGLGNTAVRATCSRNFHFKIEGRKGQDKTSKSDVSFILR